MDFTKNKDLISTTFSSTRAIFGGVAVYSAIQAINAQSTKKELTSAIASLILVIAYIHYTKMSSIEDNTNLIDKQQKITNIRYSDWIITVPLLLFELFILLNWIKVDDSSGTLSSEYWLPFSTILGLSIAMLVSGYISEKNKYTDDYFYYISCFCLLLIAGIIFYVYYDNKDNQDEDNETENQWLLIFFGFWVLYAYGFNKDSNTKNIIYNITDIVTKALFSFAAITLI